MFLVLFERPLQLKIKSVSIFPEQMYFESVQFANGKAIEARSLLTKMLVYSHIAGMISSEVSAPLPTDLECVKSLNHFIDASLRSLSESSHFQWLFVCTDVELFPASNSVSFEEKFKCLFGHETPLIKPNDPESHIRSELGDGILRRRSLMLDLNTGRIFFVSFDFAGPIYQGTVLAGCLAPSTEQPENIFEIRECLSWCGSKTTNTSSLTNWTHQQLNAWFFSPIDESCWYRPQPSKDPFRFHIDMMLQPQKTQPDTSVPVLTPNGSKWIDSHRVEEIRVFRLYLTQYPFIYSIMPDDDIQVTKLKEQLKTSTDSPMLLTIPTSECEQFVRTTFRKTPKHKYHRWQCARYSGQSFNAWIPIQPI
jgi:hypothetical protein